MIIEIYLKWLNSRNEVVFHPNVNTDFRIIHHFPPTQETSCELPRDACPLHSAERQHTAIWALIKVHLVNGLFGAIKIRAVPRFITASLNRNEVYFSERPHGALVRRKVDREMSVSL